MMDLAFDTPAPDNAPRSELPKESPSMQSAGDRAGCLRDETDLPDGVSVELKMDPSDREFMDLWQQVDRLYGDYARSRGLTFMSFNVLDLICCDEGDCTQKRICEETQYPKQSVNLIVREFLNQGYVELKEVPSDRRNKVIRLTSKGLAFAEEILGPVRKAERAADAQCTKEEWNLVLQVLRRYAERLSKEMRSI